MFVSQVSLCLKATGRSVLLLVSRSVCRSVGHISELRAVFALLVLRATFRSVGLSVGWLVGHKVVLNAFFEFFTLLNIIEGTGR